jgi:hypothetical protein
MLVNQKGEFMLHEFNAYDSSRFNGLLAIEAADAKMRASNVLPFAVFKLGPLFARHNMCEFWGLSLLHKHWKLECDELPIQDVGTSRDRQEYITAPRTSFRKDFWPCVLAVGCQTGSTLIPLEFSSDPCAEEANSALRDCPDFSRDFCQTVLSNGLEQTFGLFVAKQKPRPGYELVEFNFEERVSVLRETLSAEARLHALIETSWLFLPDAAANACTTKCAKFCDATGGAHTGNSIHQVYHDPNGLDELIRKREKEKHKH